MIELITDKEFLVGVMGVIFASNGLFQLILYALQASEREKERKRQEETQNSLIKKEQFEALCHCVTGIAMFRITREAKRYIDRGFITSEEYHTLKHNLYDPYEALGGNGMAKKYMGEIEELPMHEGKKQDYSE